MDRRGLTRLGVAVFGLAALIIFISSLSYGASFSGIKDKTYKVGESLKFDFSGQEYYLKITTPTTSFASQGKGDKFSFKLTEQGAYTFIVTIKNETQRYTIYAGTPSAATPENTNSTVPKVNNETVVSTITDDTNSTFSLDQSIVVNSPVRWKTNFTTDGEKKIKIPRNAFNFSVGDASNRAFRLNSRNLTDGQEVTIDGSAPDGAELTYYTSGPKSNEVIKSKIRKEVRIYSDDGLTYGNVLAYTNISEQIRDKDQIKVYWKEKNQYVDFNAMESSDGTIENITWTAPSSNNQTYVIIIITNAEHLDSDRAVISDIYPSVKDKDGSWSETIGNGEYVRVKFEKNLTNKNDITVWARTISGDPVIEVYQENKNTSLAVFYPLRQNSYQKVMLDALGSQTADTFDLKISNGSVAFDHIIDPSFFAYTNVQRGWVSMTATTMNISISEVDPENSFVIINTRSASSTPNILQVTANLTNSTNIKLDKFSATATTVEWQVISGSSFLVQRGEFTTSTTATTLTANITEVNTTDSFIIVTSRMNSNTANQLTRSLWAAQFNNASQLNFTRGVTGTATSVSWQVVSWDGALVRSGAENIFTAPKLINYTSPSINLSNTFILSSLYTSSLNAINASVQNRIVNSTQIFFGAKGNMVTAPTRVSYFLITSPSINVRNGTTSLPSAAVSAANFSSVNLSRSLLLGSYNYNTASTTWGNVYPTFNLTNASQARFQKGAATGITNISWFVVELADVRDTAPLVGLNAPPDQYYVSDPSQDFSANFIDYYGNIKNATFYIWDIDGNELFHSASIPLTGLNNETNVTYTLPSEGNFSWSYLACDSSDNCGFGGNFTIIYDHTNPQVDFTDPSETNNSVSRQNYLDFNVSVNDPSPYMLNMTLFRINEPINDTDIVNSTYFDLTSTISSMRYFNLPDGYYYMNATAMDVAGNNFSSISYAKVDTTFPSVNVVQSGTLLMSATNVNVSLPVAVNTSSSFVMLSVRSGSSTANINSITANLSNATQISFSHFSATATTVEWQVISDERLNVIRGEETTISAATRNITRAIPSINLSNSFILVTSRMNSNTAANTVGSFFTGEFENETMINFTRAGAMNTVATVSWQVVSWANATVQSGSINANFTSAPVIIDSVNPSQTFITFSSRVNSTSAINASVQATLINSTMAAFRVFGNSISTLPSTVSYFVVSHPSIAVQSGKTLVSGLATTQTANISAVNSSRAFIVDSYTYSTASTNWNAVYTTYNMTNNTQLQFQKNTATGNNNHTWFAVELVDLKDEAPNVTLISPNNNSYVSDALNTFNATLNDSFGNIQNATLYIWDLDSNVVHQSSVDVTGADNFTSISASLPLQENYSWTYFACDLESNCRFGDNFSIVRDSTDPTIDFSDPSITNNSVSRQNYVDFNVTATDNSPFVVNFSIYQFDEPSNDTILVNSTTINGDSLDSIRFFSLADGYYYMNATAVDAAGNSRSTISYVKIDTSFPSMELVQSGTLLMSATNVNVSLPVAVNTSSSFVMLSVRSGSSTANINSITANLSNATQISFSRFSATAATVEWQVISSSELSVIRGEETTASAATRNITRVIPEINLSNSFIVVSSRMNSAVTTNTVGSFFTGEFENETLINFTRAGAMNTVATVSWQVVSWANSTVQSGSVNANFSSFPVILSPVDTSRTFITFSSRVNSTSAVNATVQGTLVNSTLAAFRVFGNSIATMPSTVSYFIVSHPAITVQSGKTLVSGLATTQTANITRVNESRTFLLDSYTYNTASVTWANIYTSYNLSNETQIKFQKGGATGNNNHTWFAVSLDSPDTLSPNVNLITPRNESNLSTKIVSFNGTFTDDHHLLNSTLLVWNSSDDIVNQTSSTVSGIFAGINVSVLLPTDGEYYWNYFVCDSVSNCAYNESNLTITVDSTAPLIEFGTPTLANASSISEKEVIVNATADDIHLSNITVFLYNSSMNLVKNITSATAQNLANFTNLSDGRYFFNASAYDTFRNVNFTSTRQITVDTRPPALQIAYPLNNAGYTVNVSSLNYTCSEIGFAWYSTSNGTVNSSAVSCGTNFTNVPSFDGVNFWTLYANDSLGNLNSTNVTFTRDTAKPSILFGEGTEENSSFIPRNWIYVNVTAIDANLVNITTSLYNSTSHLVRNITNTSSPSTVNFTNLADGAYFFNASAYDTLANSNRTNTSRVVIDTRLPVIRITYPQGIIYGNLVTAINYTFTDANPSFCWYSIDFGATNSTALQCGTNFTSLSAQEGQNIWTLYMNDSAGNLNMTNVTFVKDTLVPLIDFGAETEINASIIGKDNIFVNVTSNDSSLSNITILLYNVTGLVKNVTSAISPFFFNFTGLPDGRYFFNSTSYDSANNFNRTATYNVTIDLLAPSLVVLNPRNLYNYSSTNVSLNISAIDTTLRSCWYTLDNATTNISITSCGNTTFIVNDGVSNITVYANDSLGRLNSSSLSFLVDSVNPQIAFSSATPTNASLIETDSIYLNVSINETNFANITYRLYNTTGSISLLNQTTYYTQVNSINWTGLSLGRYQYNVTVYDLAMRTNKTETRTINLTRVAPLVNLLYPVNGSNFSNYTIDRFTFTTNDSRTVANCSLYVNWNGTWQINQTLFNVSLNSAVNFSSIAVSTDGYYSWNVQCFDDLGNRGTNASNFSFASFLPGVAPALGSINQTSNNGSSPVFLSWSEGNHTAMYNIYYSSNGTSFTFLNQTNSTNFTDTTFPGQKRRFYYVSTWNPTYENFSTELFAAQVYTLSKTTNTRNWISFYTNTSLKTANDTLNEIRNITSIAMWNATTQKAVACNSFSCPSFPSCTSTNCNFEISNGAAYEVNLDPAAANSVNWSTVGKVYAPTNITLIKNATSTGKNWISFAAATRFANAQSVLGNVSSADAITRWNSQTQSSQGLIPSPLPVGPKFIGTNFPLSFEEGYEISVNQTVNFSTI